MKINPLSAAWNMINTIRDRDSSGQNSQQQDSQHEKNKNSEPDTIEVTDEKVAAALQDFNKDGSAHTAGLSAEIEGRGPGMKVKLKDGTGAFVRVLTGEEFLKLKSTAQGEKASRGRLLDRKF